MAQVPFKAAEAHLGQPVTLRHQEENWLRVTEIRGGKRTFAYVPSGEGGMSTRRVKLLDKAAEQPVQT
ncbi:hypothetical protein FJ872_24015 [Mesorhizobium sp. B2-5-9]|uniref:hypothetical protein n=1 Tax=unclassified Mesorhizobium TaxID=325217 RepID=UPI00112EDC67|nr:MULTISPECIES: hypothetical protein [unclassified Mesorhizobium]MBZ9683885.1 hypothetical protein [Mesorhizobium sp. CO1-1-2]MBZ9699098.1 hypothetical protein [Mesorhizobium sp. CO1-1-9]MBZ9725386.1 hypothetical protein [Mesorhizobium sp. CO1-1-11]MBZ9923677.1 hypothetical protein [Mesorhizobium sp. BR1-1-4]TPK07032.1 hypothetical protein FJ872_24015 [Mesorhizobium sp. B2-5-9]